MGCPFARFANNTALPFVAMTEHGKTLKTFHSTASHQHHHTSTAGPSYNQDAGSSLCEALRKGTAKAHRQVEKSKGVSVLLQSVSVPSNSQHHSNLSVSEEDRFPFERQDYVRWNVMLACIYVVLEASLVASSSHPLVHSLLADSTLVKSLARTRSLLLDIDSHLTTLQDHTGATLHDLADASRDTYSSRTDGSNIGVDVEDPVKRQELYYIVDTLLPIALEFGDEGTQLPIPIPTASRQMFTPEHVDILTPAQVHATLDYVRHMISLAGGVTGLTHRNTVLSTLTSKAGLMLSHAYTRYLGDLSGGQHILKRVSKRFPTSSPSELDGFQFYNFSSAGEDDGLDLKARFREAMEEGFAAYSAAATIPTATATASLVSEAQQAFILNTGLFESLLPPEHRMAAMNINLDGSHSVSEKEKLGVPQHKQVTGHFWHVFPLQGTTSSLTLLLLSLFIGAVTLSYLSLAVVNKTVLPLSGKGNVS